ncbi:wax ester/triacylglycerol synthase domain-containing protein [Mycobacterium sp. 4D054]|uniref:wax ester/triacylglycerol synthase domain-containing protein n=1 Tax=Mycobacterium sp. 4D054 TaxID=3457440 RepID=UPI003FD2443C
MAGADEPRLAVADALKLNLQTATASAHSMSLIILEASADLDHETLREVVATSLPRLRRFRSRLVHKPLGVGRPVWADVHGYDARTQIHRATAPLPGGERELADVLTRLSVDAQHRSRALWHAWTIDGLAGGRWGLAVMTSPVLADTPLWELLVSTEPDRLSHPPAETGFGPAPSIGGLVADTVSEIVQGQLAGTRVIVGTVSGAVRAVCRAVRGVPDSPTDTEAVSSMRGPVPITVLNAPPTARRAVSLARLRLDDVKAVSDAFGSNTATVVLTALTLSLRDWLHRYGDVPDAPLLIEVPLSEPAGDPADRPNPSRMGLVRAPVQLDDPVQILTNLHTATERLNIDRCTDDEKSSTADDLASMASLLPPEALRWASALRSGMNVPAWRPPARHCRVSFLSAQPGYCGGARVAGTYTSAPLAEGRGLSLTVTTRADVMDLCVSACPDNVPEIGDIAGGIVDGVDVLLAAAAKSPRGEGRSVVTEMTSYNLRRS